MTVRGRLVTLFPFTHLAVGIASVISFINSPSFANFLVLIFVWYLMPPLCFRIHNQLCPLLPGKKNLSDNSKYSAWWGSQQMQIVYTILPQLESFLRLIPGAYSAWLRLWGSKIGKGVYWAPIVEVIDRSLLEVGDRVFIGYRVSICSHTVIPKSGRQILHIAPVRVGDDAFIGGACGLGLGSIIEAGELLPINTRVYLNRRYK